MLHHLYNNPYFGSFSFALNGENAKEFRLGKTDISDKTNQLVLDWRNPICTLYYEQSLGAASYDAPVGLINGVLTSKNQILIDIFGVSGYHARTVVGTNQLPLDFSVEIEGIFDVGDDFNEL